jgi:hypothetical protein
MSKNLKKPASLAILISCARSSFKDHKPHHHREAIRNIWREDNPKDQRMEKGGSEDSHDSEKQQQWNAFTAILFSCNPPLTSSIANDYWLLAHRVCLQLTCGHGHVEPQEEAMGVCRNFQFRSIVAVLGQRVVSLQFVLRQIRRWHRSFHFSNHSFYACAVALIQNERKLWFWVENLK